MQDNYEWHVLYRTGDKYSLYQNDYNKVRTQPSRIIQYLTFESTPTGIVLRSGKKTTIMLGVTQFASEVLLAFSYINGHGSSLLLARFSCAVWLETRSRLHC